MFYMTDVIIGNKKLEMGVIVDTFRWSPIEDRFLYKIAVYDDRNNHIMLFDYTDFVNFFNSNYALFQGTNLDTARYGTPYYSISRCIPEDSCASNLVAYLDTVIDKCTFEKSSIHITPHGVHLNKMYLRRGDYNYYQEPISYIRYASQSPLKDNYYKVIDDNLYVRVGAPCTVARFKILDIHAFESFIAKSRFLPYGNEILRGA